MKTLSRGRLVRAAEVLVAGLVVSLYGLPVVAACGLPLILAPAVGFAMVALMN
jgi:hypothetical protein